MSRTGLGNDPPLAAGERKDVGRAGTERKVGQVLCLPCCSAEVWRKLRLPTLVDGLEIGLATAGHNRNKACQVGHMQFILSHQEMCAHPNTNGLIIKRQFISVM